MNACQIIEDDFLRIRLARNGIDTARQYTWERAVELFEKEVTE